VKFSLTPPLPSRRTECSLSCSATVANVPKASVLSIAFLRIGVGVAPPNPDVIVLFDGSFADDFESLCLFTVPPLDFF
jgi:hypothetical protein